MSIHENQRPLDEFEAQLAALRPAPTGIDRDALLYAAGRAAGAISIRTPARPRRWLSPLVTVASVALAATFAALWWNQASRPPQIVHASPDVAVELPAAVAVDDASLPPTGNSTESYFHLRQVALREGIDAWPQRWPSGHASPPPTARSLWPPGDS